MSPRIAILALLCATPLFAQDLPRYDELEYPELREVQVPPITSLRFANGMQVYLLEDHELPLVRGSAMLRLGSLQEPDAQAGLAELTGTVMRTGGIPGMSGDALDERLEAIAASVSAGFERTSGTAGFSCLSENLDEVLIVFSEMLRRPQFAEDKLELAKVAMKTAIASRNDQPSEILRREFRSALYGPDSRFSRQPEYATLAAIGRDDLVAFHGRLVPSAVSLALWGDFDTATMQKQLEDLFGDWEAPPAVHAEVLLPKGFGPGGVHYVEKTDVNQASIRIGHFSVDQMHADYVPLQVLSTILGGGFSSRLVKEIRTRRGLAYSAYGVFVAPAGQRGLFVAGCDTKLETTGQAIEAIMAELERIRTEEVSADELARAKESILNNWVFKFDSRGAVVQRQMQNAFEGLPDDFLESYKRKVSEVTPQDLLRVAQEHLRPDLATIVVVGDAAGFDRPLSDFGEVTAIDIAIPPPPMAALAADAASRERGLALLAGAAEAMGSEVLAGLQGIRLAGFLQQGPMAIDMERSLRFYDAELTVLSTPMGAMRIVRNGGQVVQQMGPQSQTISLDEAGLAAELLGDPLWLLRHYRDEGLTVVGADGAATVEDVHGNRVTVQFDEEGRITSIAAFEDGQELVRTLSDYIEVDGLTIYHKVRVVADGVEQAVLDFDTVDLNPTFEEGLFDLPE